MLDVDSKAHMSFVVVFKKVTPVSSVESLLWCRYVPANFFTDGVFGHQQDTESVPLDAVPVESPVLQWRTVGP